MTALERATRKLVQYARRWRLGLKQDRSSQKICAWLLANALDRYDQVEARAKRRRARRAHR